MAGYKIQDCTDDEILNELKELGYDDISPEIFRMMKKDLSLLISGENSDFQKNRHQVEVSNDWKSQKSYYLNSDGKQRVGAPLRDLNTNLYSSSSNGRKRIVKKLDGSDFLKTKPVQTSSNRPEIRKISSLQHRFSDSELYASFLQSKPPESNVISGSPPLTNKSFSSLSLTGNSIYGENKSFKSIEESESDSYISKERYPVRQLSVVKELEDPNENIYLSTSAQSGRSSEVKVTPIRNKNLAQDYKLSDKPSLAKSSSPRFQGLNASDLELSLSSLSIDGKLKRKILKHKAGIPIVTEEFVNTPSIFSSAYPDTINSSKSFSNSDLSFKSNSSTGSLGVLSPDCSLTPRSDFSLTTKNRLLKRPRKKNDPVAMYNYYKKFWDNFKPPGEKTHGKLRWAVRDKMLDYSL